MSKRFIFNCSLPRSGSELLQTILSQHPEVYGSTTSPLLEFQYAARNNMNLPEVKSQDQGLMANAFLSMCGQMAQGFYGALTEKPIVCDKNRGWSHYYEWLAQWCPDPKIICMVRDPRAIVWSFEKAYRASRHLPAGPDNPAELRGMTFGQRAEHWMTSAPFGLSLLRFQDSLDRGISKNILFVRYEDLVADGQNELDQVLSYAGITPHTFDFGKLEKTTKEDSTAFGPYGNHDVRSKLDTTTRDDWQENIPVAVSKLVVSRTKTMMDLFNYES